MTRTVPNPPADPIRIATIIGRQKIHVTVLAPLPPAVGFIRLAHERGELDSPPPLGATSGLPITNGIGAAELEWSGELWALGDVTNAGVPLVDFEL